MSRILASTIRKRRESFKIVAFSGEFVCIVLFVVEVFVSKD